MKKIDLVIVCLTILNILVLLWVFQLTEEEQVVEKRVEEKVSAVTLQPEKTIPAVEDETLRRLHEAGLDGGFSTVETSLQQ